jgi:Ca-activated chloride channel family protein
VAQTLQSAAPALVSAQRHDSDTAMRQKLVPLLMLIGAACTAEPQTPESFQISVNVDLVVLNPVVRDRSGQFASDLREEDFAIYEDGVRQSIKLFRHEDVPVTVGLVVDHSGSMKPKLPDVIAAARTFAVFSRPDDRMFVVNFNEKVTMHAPDGIQIGNRSNALANAIAGTPATGRTALYDAALRAFAELRAGGSESPQKKVLIVISDGGDNSSAHKLADLLKTAEESSVLVYTIGIFDEEDEDRNPGVLTRLARATGGEAFFPSQHEEVVAICESIARDIRNQYTVGYVSTNEARTSAWRSIRLTAAAAGHGKLLVRTRTGYIAGSQPQ